MSYLCDMNKIDRQTLLAHLSLLGAACCWGLMAPLGKDAMQHGITGFTLVACRLLGGAALFWIASLFAPKERVERKDRYRFILAAVFGLLNGFLYASVLSTLGSADLIPVGLVISVVSALAGGGICILLTRLLHRAGIAIDHDA